MIGLYGWLELYEFHNNLVVSEEISVLKLRIKYLKNAIHGVLSNLEYLEKSRVLADNKNLVWRQFYFSGPLAPQVSGPPLDFLVKLRYGEIWFDLAANLRSNCF